jgi:hypothetical protein
LTRDELERLRVEEAEAIDAMEKACEKGNAYWMALAQEWPDVDMPNLTLAADAGPLEIDTRMREALHFSQESEGVFMRTLALGVDRGLPEALGFRSVEHYCQERLGLSETEVWRCVLVGRKLRSCTTVDQAYRKGQLSKSQAAEILRIVTPVTVEAWTQYARYTTVRELRSVVSVAVDMRKESTNGRVDVLPPAHSELADPVAVEFRDLILSQVGPGGDDVYTPVSGSESGVLRVPEHASSDTALARFAERSRRGKARRQQGAHAGRQGADSQQAGDCEAHAEVSGSTSPAHAGSWVAVPELGASPHSASDAALHAKVKVPACAHDAPVADGALQLKSRLPARAQSGPVEAESLDVNTQLPACAQSGPTQAEGLDANTQLPAWAQSGPTQSTPFDPDAQLPACAQSTPVHAGSPASVLPLQAPQVDPSVMPATLRRRVWIPEELETHVQDTLALCRLWFGSPAPTGTCIEMMVQGFLTEYEEEAKQLCKDNPIETRDGWRCTAPGCTRMVRLHKHHLKFKRHGGSDKDPNITSLCPFHHLKALHSGRMHAAGSAPHDIVYAMGVQLDGRPTEVYEGDTRVWSRVA